MIDAMLRNKGLTAAMIAVIFVSVGFIVNVRRGPSMTPNTEEQPIRVVTVVDGLKLPWGLAFLPNGDMLVTEKWTGKLRIIRNGVLQPESIAGIPTVYAHAQGGLLDVALHPRFTENGFIYLTYSKPGDRGSTVALARGHFDGSTLTDLHDIYVCEAWGEDNGQYGSRIAFGKDGMLYLSVGDRRDRPMRAQDMRLDAGKILRLNDDGTIPNDNPFVGQPTTRPAIYASGIRNPDGLVIDPVSGNIFEDELGPQGGDELNLILSGRNYGWPVITWGVDYGGGLINGGLRQKEGMEQPLAYWVPSISPSGLALYSGNRFPKWRGNLFVGALSGQQLRRVVLDGTKVVHQESLLGSLHHRIRDVRQGPDGLLYLLTDEDPGLLLRIEPLELQTK